MILTILQVRVGSTRLPGKALLPIKGRAMWLYALDACPSPMIVATPTSNQIIVDMCRDLEVPFATRRDEDDVLGRFVKALDVAEEQYEAKFDQVLRITADCPMLTPALVRAFLRRCSPDEETYWTNRPLDPDGFDLELFPASALRLANERVQSKEYREHVCPYIKQQLKVQRVRISCVHPDIKLSVDTQEEYLFVKYLMEERIK